MNDTQDLMVMARNADEMKAAQVGLLAWVDASIQTTELYVHNDENDLDAAHAVLEGSARKEPHSIKALTDGEPVAQDAPNGNRHVGNS